MTSMDSGVDMGNDSNDSFITQQEFCTAGAGTATTTTTTITTTLTAASNYESGTNTFLTQTTPFTSVSAIQKDTDNDNSELFMPMYIGSKPSISPTANPIVLATAANNTELMKKLLTNGMSPDFHDHKGQTALHIASSLGHTDMVQLLLLHGANPNQRDCVGNTPLHFASRRCHISIMTLLLLAGAEIVSRDKDGFNPLQLMQEHLRSCPERFKDVNVDVMLKVKQEIHELINLLAYQEKQKNSQEAAETLSKLYSSLSVSKTAD